MHIITAHQDPRKEGTYYYPYFIDEETEAQRDELAYLEGSHSQDVEAGIDQVFPIPKIGLFFLHDSLQGASQKSK